MTAETVGEVLFGVGMFLFFIVYSSQHSSLSLPQGGCMGEGKRWSTGSRRATTMDWTFLSGDCIKNTCTPNGESEMGLQ